MKRFFGLLMGASLVVACGPVRDVGQPDSPSGAKKGSVVFKGGSPTKAVPSLSTEICGNDKDDDGDGLVDEDCDDGRAPGSPPGFGSSTGEDPTDFYPWDEWFVDVARTDTAEVYIGGGGRTEAQLIVTESYDDLVRLQEEGEGYALHAAKFDVDDGDEFMIQSVTGERGDSWFIVAALGQEYAWALSEGAMDVAAPPETGDRW